VERNFNWDIGKERLIKQNILIGNYEGAIDAALKCGRTAEALIIAYSVNQNTFNSTLKTFFTETTDSFITDILKHIAHKDTEELVRKYDL
jgi:protein transport protein SEC31